MSDEVWIIVSVYQVVVAQLYHLFESVVDEDEADECREAFFSKAREVLHQEAGVCGDQHQTEQARPQANPQSELKVVEAVFSGERGQIWLPTPPYFISKRTIQNSTTLKL